MAEILAGNNVGIALDGFTEGDIESGIANLLELVADPQVAERCREVAEANFSLEQGVKSYDAIYKTLALES